MRKAEIELEILSSKSKENPKYIFRRLYRLLFNKDMFMVAYVRLSSHEGNMTAGTDERTIDGFSKELVDEIINELRMERYYPKAVRRTYIPKKDGRQRPLGIPSFRDKLVQEVIRTILEAIYEPTFLESSHGYRPKRSCHTSLCQVKKGMGTSWVIEGDIKGFFDNIDHEILLKLLSKRIDDGRFIELVKRFLKAGYMEFKEIHNSLSGTPQGGIISPILANIYLHELDSYMESLKTKHEKGKRRESNPRYDVLYRKRRKKLHEGKVKEAEEILRKMRKLPTQDLMDEDFVRIRYIRYADDFLITGIRAIAAIIYANELLCLSNIVITPLYPYSY